LICFPAGWSPGVFQETFNQPVQSQNHDAVSRVIDPTAFFMRPRSLVENAG
jgi:hypothetical protein